MTGGRPSKLTAEIIKIITDALIIGAPYKDACYAARIDYDTFNNWIKRGEQEKKGEYFEFLGLVRKIESEAALRHLATINNAAAKGDWKASEAWLKAKRKKEWGNAVDLSNSDGSLKITVEYARDKTDDTPPA